MPDPRTTLRARGYLDANNSLTAAGNAEVERMKAAYRDQAVREMRGAGVVWNMGGSRGR